MHNIIIGTNTARIVVIRTTGAVLCSNYVFNTSRKPQRCYFWFYNNIENNNVYTSYDDRVSIIRHQRRGGGGEVFLVDF